MTLRECVRRHGRLPQIVVVDGGKEFRSIYFETFCARYEITKKHRPPAEGRFGSVGERLFGTINTQFFYNLMGNTQITRNVRQVTKSNDPKNQAVWSISRVFARLCEYAFDVYETIDHPALGQSPREAFAFGMAQTGNRPQRLISYDEAFRMSTLPTTQKGWATVSPGRGVKINHIYYWCGAFRDAEIEGAKVDVRYDPFDVGTAYAYIREQWVLCRSEYYAIFQGRSERELLQATEELRARKRNHSQQFSITARKLADFLESVEAEEVLLAQRLRDGETRSVWDAINGSEAAETGDGIDGRNGNGAGDSSTTDEGTDDEDSEDNSDTFEEF